MMEPFAVLMILGVRVREVKDLSEGNIWLPEDRLLFIDSAMNADDREHLCLQLIPDVQDVEVTA